MKDQSLNNHAKYDPAFHYFLLPVLLLTFGFTVKHAYDYPNAMTLWIVLLSFALLVWLFLTRRFALKVQDRLIRLEERLRMERLLPNELRSRTSELTVKQCVAIRFASDGELAELVKKTLDEKLAPKQIKAAIQNWRPDFDRV
ncbi:MAG: hypothetical protein FJW30_25535 [Acidobacteria bacterium]|nr:hypothetical protein [Acidobacteriota bacterium]